MSVRIEMPFRRTVSVIPVMVFVASLLLMPSGLGARGDPPVEFRLRASAGGSGTVDVLLSFKLAGGESVVLKPEGESKRSEQSRVPGARQVEIEMRPGLRPGYLVEELPEGEGGWSVTATSASEVSVRYRVKIGARNGPQSAGEAAGEAIAAIPMVSPELTVLMGADLFVCPRRGRSLAPLSDEYRIGFDLGKHQKALVPWETASGGGGYTVSGTSHLLQDYVVWGRISLEERKSSDTRIAVGFPRDTAGMNASRRGEYAQRLSALFARLSRILGKRPDLPRLTILVFRNRPPESGGHHRSTLRHSMVLFPGGGRLTGRDAAGASMGLIQLWNRWYVTPKIGGGAEWFQDGLPWYYCYRVAALEKMMTGGDAFSEFSRRYLEYVTNPLSTTSTLEGHGEAGAGEALFSTKGAVICASIDDRLRRQTGEKKTMDWFLGELVEKHGGSGGGGYTLVDIEEILEEATGRSWSRFFAERVRGRELLPASDFSSSWLFGGVSTNAAGRPLEAKGSGRSWLFLVVAMVVIILVPLVFSAYVRRSVRLDLSMPRILPPDEDEPED